MNAPDGGELWRLALEHSPVGMTLVGLEGQLLVVNRALCDMLGYDADTLTTKGFQELTHPDDLDSDLELFHQTLAGEIDSYRLRKRYLHAEGRIVWGDLSVALVKQPDGSPLHFISQILDITELTRALHVMDEFVASVSHELRTPLTSVLGYLELLRARHDLPDGVRTHLDVIHRNAGSLKLLVSDLLDVAQAREGGLELHRKDTDLTALVLEALDAARPLAGAAELDLAVDVPDTLVAHVDGPRMRQVVDNLVSNAVKYTPPGGSVTVALSRDGDDAVLTVRDDGIGMTEQEAERAFTRFFRGEAARRREIPGTGLGLNIASSIVDAHAGKIELESEPGRGSRFTVRLPIGDAQPAPQPGR
ncbi:ATP-binding protein [Nocardioides dilutus]